LAALQRDGPAGAADCDGDDDGGSLLGVWLAGAEEAGGVLETGAGPGVPWDCGWLVPQAVSRRTAAATAVVMANPFLFG
jgi:hypothetical protein